MQVEKEALRAELLRRRKAMSAEATYQAGKAIVRHLPAAADWSNIKSVHMYRSLPELGEVDTQPVMDWLVRSHPHVRIATGESHPGAPFPEGQFDVIFVPVLGFDREGYRLGMGGGWYDRWLATQPNATKIGLAYAWAETKNMPHEPHDVPLDMILRA